MKRIWRVWRPLIRQRQWFHQQRLSPPGDWARPLPPHLYKGPDGPTAKSLEALRYINRVYGDILPSPARGPGGNGD